MTVAEALRGAAARLAATGETARLDAELLMAHALGTSRSELLLRHQTDPAPEAFAALVERRAIREPVAHIVGRQEFYGLDLRVTQDTLVPRGDSEVLIEAARERLAARAPDRILDLGTGSGALLLAALSVWTEAEGVGLDASAAALAVARGNAAALGLAERARMVERDWHARDWTAGLGGFDLVLCNPPYVEDAAVLAPDVRDFEPASALFAGPEGLDDYRVVIPALRDLLANGGVAVLEIGSTQERAVSEIARAAGFAPAMRRDLGGHPRAVILT